MQVVYLAGPYRSNEGIWGVAQNIERARSVARELWMRGYAVLSPHSNTAFMDGLGTDDRFLAGDLAMLERCDVVVVLPGWRSSQGTLGEIEHARSRGIPVRFWEEENKTESIEVIG